MGEMRSGSASGGLLNIFFVLCAYAEWLSTLGHQVASDPCIVLLLSVRMRVRGFHFHIIRAVN